MSLLVSSYTGHRYRAFTRLGRKNIWLRARRAWTVGGKIRTLWNVFYDGELCHRCGNRYDGLLWWCPDNELFARLYGVPFEPPYAAGCLCPRCFDKLARAAHIILEWNPRVFIDASVEPRREYLRPPAPSYIQIPIERTEE